VTIQNTTYNVVSDIIFITLFCAQIKNTTMPLTIFLKDIGERVAAWRKSRELTQQQLADKVRCDIRTIQRLENAEDYPSLLLIAEIIRVLEISSSDLMMVATTPIPQLNPS
jgi:DNA-binding XRE family transcriptional regulator